VAPPTDQINNSVFDLQNHVRPLHSNALIFEISTQICTIFGIIEGRDILNVPVILFSCQNTPTRYAIITNN